MSALYEVELMPVEPVLFSDNRSARAGEDHLIRDQDPSPHTIFGAIGGCIARMFGAGVDSRTWAAVEDYLGDWQDHIQNGATDRAELMGYFYSDVQKRAWFPRPRQLRLNQRVKQLRICKPVRIQQQKQALAGTSMRDFESYLACETDAFEVDPADYISAGLLSAVLCADEKIYGKPLSSGKDHLPVEQLYKPEVRLGLGMNYHTNSAREGILFSRPYRRFHSDIDLDLGEWRSTSIVAYFRTRQAIDPEKLSQKRLAFLGGDRGRALIRFDLLDDNKPLHNLCQKVQDAVAGSAGFFSHLLTPMVRQGRWPRIAGQRPLAAAIGKGGSVSGWRSNPAQEQQPRPIRRLVPAGSTFFYPWPPASDEAARKKLIHDYWLEPVTVDSGNDYRNSGFGRMLIGVWRHED